jgi:hypothetical protein
MPSLIRRFGNPMPSVIFVGGDMAFAYQTLWNELNDDPLSKGYSGMSNASAALNLNQISASRWLERLDQSDIFEAINDTEWDTLSSASQAEVNNLLQVGTVNGLLIGPGTRARSKLRGVFGVSSSTAVELIELATERLSRASEIGLPLVREGHVQKARAQFGG